MHNGKFYPRSVPFVGDPAREKIVKSEEEHIKFNPSDHADFLEEQAGKPTMTAIATAEQTATDNERERCAKLAEAFGTDESQRIADAIRGVSVHEASVAPTRRDPFAAAALMVEVPAQRSQSQPASAFMAAELPTGPLSSDQANEDPLA